MKRPWQTLESTILPVNYPFPAQNLKLDKRYISELEVFTQIHLNGANLLLKIKTEQSFQLDRRRK